MYFGVSHGPTPPPPRLILSPINKVKQRGSRAPGMRLGMSVDTRVGGGTFVL